MSKTVVVTARLDGDKLAALDQLAEATSRTRSSIVACAVERYLDEESERLAGEDPEGPRVAH